MANNPVNFLDPTGTQKLTKKTVKGPTKGNCGNFEWIIQWILHAITAKGGWVIQHVQVKFDVKDCDNKPIDVKKHTKGLLDPKWWPVWEAWKINKKQKVTTYAEKGDDQDDRYYMPEFGECTKGTITMQGSADFFEDLTLPKDFTVSNKPPTYILPATKTDPKLKGGSGAIKHNAKAEWDCCPKGTVAETKLTTE